MNKKTNTFTQDQADKAKTFLGWLLDLFVDKNEKSAKR